MHWKQQLSKVRWRLEVAQYVIQKVVGVIEASIPRAFVLCLKVTSSGSWSPLDAVGLAIVEYDNFVNAEDCSSSSDLCG